MRTRALRVYRRRSARQQLPQHELQNSAVGVILRFLWRVDSHQRLELRCLPVRSGTNFHLTSRDEVRNHITNSTDLDDLISGQTERLRQLIDAAPFGEGRPPLSTAELRVLPYLQTHLTLPEIGARLFVSRHTVSSEVSAIYRKLGASSRSEAVDRATALGLLGA